MRIYLAYISIVLLWATTPLAIKWSTEGTGFLFAAAGRMTIGLACLLLMLALSRQRLAWHRKALQTYLAVAVQIYGSMLAVYWAAPFIPSGWISVIFGLSPLMTALLAAIWLGERSLTPGNLLAYVLGISGLWIMFGSAMQLGHNAVLGIVGVLVSTFLQAISSVWVKRIAGKIPALSQVTGGLLLSVPVYLITWALLDGHWPADISSIGLASIVYLGMIATTVGFVLYYYLLIHQSATRVALITLISPVMALLLGHAVNHEPLTIKVVAGTLLILCALLAHTFSGRLNSSK
ncbi:EamA domain-containing membrane protein RarD [Methylobacter tundripaludum]|uniref:EamA domain-containing membrane protein RarD n=1 Tax=Methylobacter tundripaludum TaxID=173365 RepID=A0A2S6GVR1_9GAMM|nr:DMT family transporter [Methylobacter tundripaludum]PPK69322.1 EamA domain-containing membrane protein RarD [Methylobacter tundripaludum]